MTTVVFILADHMLATSLTLPSEMLNAAKTLAHQTFSMAEKATLELKTVAVEKQPVSCQAGINLQPTLSLDEVNQADLIFLPALWRNPRRVVAKNAQLLPWLRHQYSNGAHIAAVGTGSCFMAEAGLLDAKPATTHWYYFDQFQRDYPLVQLKRQHFITQAGTLYCAASINSLADLTIHFIQRFYNKVIANHVERHFSHEIRRDYDVVSYFEGGNNNHADEAILQAQIWMQDNLAKSITVHDIAEHFGMSYRNFSRRFKTALGKTPLQFLQEMRIKAAKGLLCSSNLSIGDIAYKVGYTDVSHFSQLFKKLMSVTPHDYRITVRAKLFNV